MHKFRLPSLCPIAYVGLLSFSTTLQASYSVQDSQNALDDAVLPILEQVCIGCHDDSSAKGDIDFTTLHEDGLHRLDIRFWIKVREQLRAETMPPEGKKPLDAKDKETLLHWISQNEQALLHHQQTQPGAARTRRMNREEYSNSLRDIFHIKSRPGDKFPKDGAGGEGFSNTGDTLTFSPLLIEKYMEAASDVVAEIWNTPEAKHRFHAPVNRADLPADLAAEMILRPVLLRCFRRPPSSEDVQKHIHIFRVALDHGANWDQALQSMLKSVLMSPKFLFLEEAPTDGQRRPLNDFEIASRLSFFLWSTSPDDELLSLAAAGQLQKPEVRKQQVQRLLSHPHARAFTRNFAGQWLRFEEIHDHANPDPRKYRHFNGRIREDFYQEIFNFMHSLLTQNGNMLDVIDSNYTFLNARLAQFYGIEGIEGEQFRKVHYTDKKRGGITTMGGILTLTSYPQRTSPVLRGKWVLESLLGAPPPPPPPDVGGIPENDTHFKEATLRQRLELHRSKPECAGCHVRLDPPGFALENFDPVGLWRDNENEKPLDTSGELPGKRAFNTPEEFRTLLMQDKDLYLRNLCIRLLGYALDRGLEVEDHITVLQLEKTLKDANYNSGALIQAVVESEPFLYRQ